MNWKLKPGDDWSKMWGMFNQYKMLRYEKYNFPTIFCKISTQGSLVPQIGEKLPKETIHIIEKQRLNQLNFTFPQLIANQNQNWSKLGWVGWS